MEVAKISVEVACGINESIAVRGPMKMEDRLIEVDDVVELEKLGIDESVAIKGPVIFGDGGGSSRLRSRFLRINGNLAPGV